MIFWRKFRMETAIRKGDTARVCALLRAGVDPDMTIGNDAILTIAVLENKPDIVDALIKAGASLPVVNGWDQMSLLHMAARRGYGEVGEVLVRKWPHLLEARDNMMRTPLHDAARFGAADMVCELLAWGADPQALDLENRTAYFRARERQYDHAAAHLKPYHRHAESPPAGWYRDGKDRILHVAYEQHIGYKIMDIFNFASAERTRICQNLETQVESSETRSFDDMEDKRVLKEAARQMKERGVDIDMSRIDPFHKFKGPET